MTLARAWSALSLAFLLFLPSWAGGGGIPAREADPDPTVGAPAPVAWIGFSFLSQPIQATLLAAAKVTSLGDVLYWLLPSPWPPLFTILFDLPAGAGKVSVDLEGRISGSLVQFEPVFDPQFDVIMHKVLLFGYLSSVPRTDVTYAWGVYTPERVGHFLLFKIPPSAAALPPAGAAGAFTASPEDSPTGREAWLRLGAGGALTGGDGQGALEGSLRPLTAAVPEGFEVRLTCTPGPGSHGTKVAYHGVGYLRREPDPALVVLLAPEDGQAKDPEVFVFRSTGQEPPEAGTEGWAAPACLGR